MINLKSALWLVLLIAMASCQRSNVTPVGDRYELTGTVVSVEPAKKQVTVAHEEIPDFMPAMTMDFTLRDEHALKILGPGDRIAAALVVAGTEYWLEELVITKATTDEITTSGSSNTVVEAKVGSEVPNFSLINQNSKPIHIEGYRGKALVLTFIYTRCPMPDQCTLMSNNFAAIGRELEKQPALYEKTHLLSVTVDPEYDTPAVLRSYGAAHSGRYSEESFKHWEFATGSEEQVKAIAEFFGLRYYPEQSEIVHGLRTAIIGPDGKVHKTYRGNQWKPAEVVSEIQKLLDHRH